MPGRARSCRPDCLQMFCLHYSAGVERSQDGAFGLGQAESHFDQRIGHECGVDGGKQGGPVPLLEAGDGDAAGRAHGPTSRGYEIDLVEHLDHGLFGHVQFAEDRSTCTFCSSIMGLEASRTCRSSSARSTSSRVARKLVTRVWGRLRMKPTVSDSRTLRREGSWSCRSLGSSVANMRRRLEHAGLGEGVEEGALAGVGVADQGDDGHGDGLAALALLAADAPDGFELLLDVVDAQIDLAAVGLELGFAGAPGADAAAELGHGLASAGQPRKLVLELR